MSLKFEKDYYPTELKIIKYSHKPKFIHEMPSKLRESFLLLGLMNNEASWLFNLVLSSLKAKNNTVEDMPCSGLKNMLMTILASKVYEGHKRANNELKNEIDYVLKFIPKKNRLKIVRLKNKLDKHLCKDSIIYKIRNISFHYPVPKDLDVFRKNRLLKKHTHSLMGEKYRADSYSELSAVAYLAVLAKVVGSKSINEAYLNVSKNVREVSTIYIDYIDEIWRAFYSVSLLNRDHEKTEIKLKNPRKNYEHEQYFFIAHPSEKPISTAIPKPASPPAAGSPASTADQT